MKWLVQAPGMAERNYLHWASDLQKAKLQHPLKRLPDPPPPPSPRPNPTPTPGNLDFSKVSLTCWQHCLQCRETLGWRECGLCLLDPGALGGRCMEPVNSGHEVIEKLLEEVTITRILLLAHKEAVKVNLSSVEIGMKCSHS